MNEIKSSNTLEEKLREFTPKQKKLIFSNLGSMQLTEGCSIGCIDCGFNAKKGIRDYIPAEVILNIFSKIPKPAAHLMCLYYASDPFDYDFDGMNYVNIHKKAEEMLEKRIYVSTSIPKGKEQLIFNLLKKTSSNIVNRISLTKFNYKRIENALSEFNFVKNKPQFQSNLDTFVRSNRISTRILDFYNDINRYKIGDKNKDSLGEIGIGCYNGTLLTPKGV